MLQPGREPVGYLAALDAKTGRPHLWALPLDGADGIFPLAPSGALDVARALWDAATALDATRGYPSLLPGAALRRVPSDDGTGEVAYWPGRKLLGSSPSASPPEPLVEERLVAEPPVANARTPLLLSRVGAPRLVAWPNDAVSFRLDRNRYARFAWRQRDRRRVLFATTADGVLHAFDAALGAEVFAFGPRVRATTAAGAPSPLAFDDAFLDAPWAGGGAACPPEWGAAGRNCQWRTLLAAALGPRGQTLVLLDVTRADAGPPGTAAPDCLAVPGSPVPGGCAGAYPTVLWQLPGAGPFGTPALARLRFLDETSTAERERSVVLVPAAAPARGAGASLLAVDAASGRLLASWTDGLSAAGRRSFGAALSGISPVDADGDGVVESLYFGDGEGRLFRIEPTPSRALRETPAELVFEEEAPAGSAPPRRRRPIRFEPVVVRAFGALAVGVALSPDGETPARFVLVPDRGAGATSAASGVARIASPDAPALGACGRDGAPRPGGWALDLVPGERIAAAPVALAGYVYLLAERASGPTRLYRLSVANGDPCRGADCCAPAPPWEAGGGPVPRGAPLPQSSGAAAVFFAPFVGGDGGTRIGAVSAAPALSSSGALFFASSPVGRAWLRNVSER